MEATDVKMMPPSFKFDISSANGEILDKWISEWVTFKEVLGETIKDPVVEMQTFRSFMTDESLSFIDMNPSDSDSDPIENILFGFRSYIFGPVNVVQERRNFNIREQREGETFDTFLSSIITLSHTCQFCMKCKDKMLRDRIVAGVRDLNTVGKLLDAPDLTLSRAIEICKTEETKRAEELKARAFSRDTRNMNFIDDEPFADSNDFEEIETKPDTDSLSRYLYRDSTKSRQSKRKKKMARGRSSSTSSKIFKDDDDDDDDDIGDGDETALNISDFLNDGDSELPCGQCDFIAKGTIDLGQHLKTVHCEARPYVCPECSRKFRHKVTLKRHFECVHANLRPFKCDQCDSTFGKNSTLKIHIRAVHDKIKPYVCDLCPATFSQLPHLNRHKMSIHDQYRPFSCDQCDKRCSTKTDLAKHVKNHHNEAKCDICNKVFQKRADLRFHLTSEHQALNTCLCETCGRSYSSQCSLNMHCAREHGYPTVPCSCKICQRPRHVSSTQNTSAANDSDSDGETKRPHLCELCGKSYSQQVGLKSHMEAVHGISKRACQCESCMAETKFEKHPAGHRNFNKPHKHRPFKCKLCKSSFTQLNALKEHESTVHTTVKRFQCEQCSAMFGSRHQMGTHMRAVHLGLKPYQCPICPARFTQQAHRTRHVTVVHEGQKNFQCDMCDKRYANKPDLKFHLKKVHGKLILFECTLCDAKFDKRKPLMDHIIAKHRGEGEGEDNGSEQPPEPHTPQSAPVMNPSVQQQQLIQQQLLQQQQLHHQQQLHQHQMGVMNTM